MWTWIGLFILVCVIASAISSQGDKMKEAAQNNAKLVVDEKRKDERVAAYTDALARSHVDPEFARMSDRERRIYIADTAERVAAAKKHIDSSNEGLAALFVIGTGVITWLGSQDGGGWNGLVPGLIISLVVCWIISNNIEKEAWAKARREVASRNLDFDRIVDIAGVRS